MKGFIFLLLCITSLTYALEIKILEPGELILRSGDEVGNGGGHFENRLTNTFLKIPDYINSAQELESLTSAEAKVLLKIQASYKNILDDTTIYFQKENDVFLIDSYHRLAVTGNKIGDPIIFNIDKLYEISPEVLTETLISIIIHELGHLISNRGHQFLDKVGAKVARAANANRSLFLLTFGDNTKYIETYDFSKIGISSHINFIYNEQVIDLEPFFRHMTPCQSENHYYNLHKNFVTKELEGTLIYRCFSAGKYRETPFVIKVQYDEDDAEDGHDHGQHLSIQKIEFKD